MRDFKAKKSKKQPKKELYVYQLGFRKIAGFCVARYLPKPRKEQKYQQKRSERLTLTPKKCS
jgi:hypothetical protein